MLNQWESQIVATASRACGAPSARAIDERLRVGRAEYGEWAWGRVPPARDVHEELWDAAVYAAAEWRARRSWRAAARLAVIGAATRVVLWLDAGVGR